MILDIPMARENGNRNLNVNSNLFDNKILREGFSCSSYAGQIYLYRLA